MGTDAVRSVFTKISPGNRMNNFEIFGLDFMIDSQFKPWLIEINLSPSLACDSALDLEIKNNLLTDTFNLIGIK